MTLTIRNDEWLQLMQEHVLTTQPELLANQKDRTLILPGWLGTGYQRDITLERDLSLTLHHLRYQEDVITVNPSVKRSCFEFSFVTTAKVSFEQQIVTADQEVFFQNSDSPGGEFRSIAEQDFLAVDIHIKKSVLAAMVMEYEETLPLAFRRMVLGRDDRPILPSLKITPAMQRLLQQIWQCPYTGLTRSLFLEAKSLELIALYIQAAQAETAASSNLSAADVDSIHQAQTVLRQNLGTPPSLIELARQVGINDRKLKQGFREMLDTTVFGYLTQQRMERACQLLQQERSVAAVATLVGYDSPTAFSGAFRRKLGMTPKAYQIQNCRRA
ncbi:MAG: helix-turn-helix transcriptional regulator [Leptolyngbya sp. SIOISBB]|nr:helix-turn-helix transcriptional regulator [Leptolyngbya sp. SIOISBB]